MYGKYLQFTFPQVCHAWLCFEESTQKHPLMTFMNIIFLRKSARISTESRQEM